MHRTWFGTAAMPGPEHYRRRINRQDQVFKFRNGKWLIGAVADGCSASPKSEAGAAQLAHAAVQSLWMLVSQGVPFSKMAGAFDRMMEKYVHASVAAYPGGQGFLTALTINDRAVDLGDPNNFLVYSAVAETLQATMLAVCVHEERGGVVLVRGDGNVYLDGKLTPFEYNDWPPYISYMLAIRGQEYPGNAADLRSKVIDVPPDFKRLGVTTDGWPWHHAPADPFGRWRYSSFVRWLRDYNQTRADKDKLPPLDELAAWSFYDPSEVNDLARKLVKESIDEKVGHRIFTDDISGLFLEKEEIP